MSNLINELVNSINSNMTAPLAALKNRNNILHQIIRSNDLQKPALLTTPKAPLKTFNLNLNEKLVHDWVLADIEALSLLKGKEKNQATNLIKDNLSVYTVYMKKLQSVDYGLYNDLLNNFGQSNGFGPVDNQSLEETQEENTNEASNTNALEENNTKKTKKELLDGVTYEAANDGSVKYFLHKDHIFTDYGQNILMAKGTETNDDAILIALIQAKEKYAGKFELTGTEEFKLKAIEVLAKNQIKVTLSPEKYNILLQEHCKQISDATSLKSNGVKASEVIEEPNNKEQKRRKFK